MSDIKSELSVRSQYWIPKHRYYELKHYCLQYPEWLKLYSKIQFKMESRNDWEIRSSTPGDPTAHVAQLRADLSRAISRIQRCIDNSTDIPAIRAGLFKAVTEDVSFSKLQALYNIPCGKDMYYDCYRRFFWLLSKEKGI